MEKLQDNQLIEALNWRYATKSFDSSKQLGQGELETLKNTVRLAPTSYGLQPFRVIVVSDEKIKNELRGAAFNQPQLTDASHIFIFARYTEVTERHVDEYANKIIETRQINLSDISGFIETIKGTVKSRSQEELGQWSAKQTYIALGILIESAALLQVDVCPMEGFNNEKFDEILDLKSQNLTSVVVAAVGYRNASDPHQTKKKVRKSEEELFINL